MVHKVVVLIQVNAQFTLKQQIRLVLNNRLLESFKKCGKNCIRDGTNCFKIKHVYKLFQNSPQ